MSKTVPLANMTQQEILRSGTVSCQGCGHAILARNAMKAFGPNTVYATVPGCIWITLVRNIPLYWTGTVFEGGAALLSGISNGLIAQGNEDMNVVGFIGDGGTADIGLQGLSAAAERNENIFWVCADNHAYMNTGGQRSGATPRYAATTTTPVGSKSRGKRTGAKNLPFILAAHNIPYVGTASIAYPGDLYGKIEYAKELKGTKFLHVQSPCPTGWGFEPSQTVKIARLMVQTGMWPVYEITEGEFKLSVKPRELKPVTEALKPQRRFRHLTDIELDEIQVDVEEKWQRLLDLDGRKMPI
jgi:pyruvate/2-oxoacid:ferredoxin oxidoreductase beta subunit